MKIIIPVVLAIFSSIAFTQWDERNNQLFEAIRTSNVRDVERLLESGIDVNAEDTVHQSALDVAWEHMTKKIVAEISEDDKEIYRLLMASGAFHRRSYGPVGVPGQRNPLEALCDALGGRRFQIARMAKIL
jgi:hypothetical protein